MILRRLVLLFILAAGLNACSTAAVSEAPVTYKNPEGERVEALSMTSPRADAASIHRDRRHDRRADGAYDHDTA